MKKTNKDFYSKHKTVLLVSCIVLFVILSIVLFFVLPSHKQSIATALQPPSAQKTENQSAQFMTAITFKHLSIYPFMCKQNGYIMKNYQNTFVSTFSPELKKYKNYLSKNDLTEIKAWDRLPEDFVRAIFFTVDTELQSLADALKKQNPSATLKDACAMLDNNAASLFEEKLKNQISEKAKNI